MTRKLTRSYSLRGVAAFIAVLTLLIAAAVLAQTTLAGRPTGKASAVLAPVLSKSSPVSLVDRGAGVVSPSVVASANASQADPKAQARIVKSYGKLPLAFEANRGQADGRVKFLSRTGGYTLFLTGDEAVLALRERSAKKSSPRGLKPVSRAASSGAAEQAAEKLRPQPGFGDKTSVVPEMPQNERRLQPLRFAAASMAGPTARSTADQTAETTTGSVLRMKLRNANPAAKVTGADELAGTSNYFIGNDPAKWRTNVPTYAKVKYVAIYPGIDLVYYGNQRQLEYDFVVAPGADPRRIAFDVRGAKRIRQNARGDLVLKVGEGEIRWHKPVAYQEKDGAQQLVAAHYAITEKNRVGFEVAEYDASRPLYIDPLIYSTYLGGSGYDEGYGIAVDSDGNAYVVGTTCSTDFPTTAGSFQTVYGGPPDCSSGGDAFVTKINPMGSALVYSTYLGGSEFELGYGRIAVDRAGNAYVFGTTCSTDFPTTVGAFQRVYAGSPDCFYGGDAFVTKINPMGSALVYSTYLGGSKFELGFGIAVDSAGNAYVTGYTGSADFPTTPGALQTVCWGGGNGFGGDGFVAKINPEGSALVYSTCLGGSNYDQAIGIAVDSAGSAYVTGFTESANLPITPGAFQTTLRGNADAFVSKINPSGSALVYSTYLGGSGGEGASAIAVDSAGNAYVTGGTGSFDFPTTPGAYQATAGEIFVTKINSSGSDLVYSTYLGEYGSGTSDIAVDSGGNAYVTGLTNGGIPADNALKGYPDAFVTKFNPTGSALVYSSYLGGTGKDRGNAIAVDSVGNAYVTGRTKSVNFPVTLGAFQTKVAGGLDAFVAKRDGGRATTTTLLSSLNPSTYGEPVTLTATVTSFPPGAPPDGETVTFKNGAAVLATVALSDGSASFTTSTLTAGTKYIKAVYGGDANFGPSTSKVLKQVVNKATTTTTLTSSLNPSNLGQAVTFTASVTPQFSGKIAGSVTFYDGTTAVGTVSLSKGAAKFTTSTLAQGTHTITATYNGNANFTGSSASLTQTVN